MRRLGVFLFPSEWDASPPTGNPGVKINWRAPFNLIHPDSQRNYQSKVLYPGTDITIHRLARQWGNALHFVGMKCFSHHTFAASPTPIDWTFCYAYTLLGTLGGGGGHDWSQPTQRGGPTPSSSISVCTRLVEAQLPSNRRKAKLPPLYPGIWSQSPLGESQLPSLYQCMYHPRGRLFF